MSHMPTVPPVVPPGSFTRIFSVRDYGAIGDGVADDTVAIQAAIDAVPSYAAPSESGGIVYFPSGVYRVTTGLTSSTPNITLMGVGNVGQSTTLAPGASIISVEGAIVGFTFNTSATSALFGGPMIRDLHVKGSSSGLGGVLLKKVNNFTIENVSISDFTTGYGLKCDGSGNVDQYGQLENFRASKNLIGVDLVAVNGLRMIGGYIDGNDNNGASWTTGSICLRQTTGDSLRCIGTVFQGAENLVELHGGFHALIGCRYEVWSDTAVEINDSYCEIIGGCWDNSLGGSIGTGVYIGASATRTTVIATDIRAVATKLTDLGVGSQILHNGSFQVDQLLANYNLTVDASNSAAGGILFSTAQNPRILYGSATPEGAATAGPGSVYLRTGGAAGTSVYIKNTGSGTTGWAPIGSLPSLTDDGTTVTSSVKVAISKGAGGQPELQFVQTGQRTWLIYEPASTNDFRIWNSSTGDSLKIDGSGNVTVPFDLLLGSTSGPKLKSGTGTPEGAVTAPIGSLFLRTDGGAGTSLYVKESGVGNTGWVGK